MERINYVIQQATDVEQMMSDVLQVTLEIFESDRAWLLYPCDPEAESWSVPMERTRPEYPGALTLGEDMPMLPEIVEVFREVLEKDDVLTISYRFQEGAYETAERFSVLSEMYMPIHPQTGKPWMFGVHQCSHYRDWTGEEKNMFREIGRRLGDALSSLLFLRNLRASESRFRHIFDLSPQPVAITDLTGRFVDVNRTLCQMSEYTKEELIGRTTTELEFYSPEKRAEFVQELQSTGSVNGLEMEFYLKDR
ncbi:MAG: PAS domain S-box protein, partial [Deltaproteobacteria bacterium]|nr:PAS domain S-box protein [Deltaproteobacteria bacterium]